MPVAEITGAITALRAAFDLLKAAIAARDRHKIEVAANEADKVLAAVIRQMNATELQMSAMIERERAHAAEIAELKKAVVEAGQRTLELDRYELRTVGNGQVYMLKAAHRGGEAAHWLCPGCYANGKKSFLQFSTVASVGNVYRCTGCPGHMVTPDTPHWLDDPA